MLSRLRPDFMAKVTDIAALEALYGAPAKPSVIKVADHMLPRSMPSGSPRRGCVFFRRLALVAPMVARAVMMACGLDRRPKDVADA